ncbi:MAG: efflux RND transporter permease subunit [Bdellovibrionia bacterium]
MKSLSEISIRRPVFAWMLMAGLMIFGAISFQRLGVSQMPDVNFPVVNVALTLENAATEVMERDVVDVIEDTVMGIEGLKNVSSAVSQGRANVTCEFELGHPITRALQEVQNRVTQVRNRLPTALDPPVITRTNPEDQPILWVLLSADEGIPLPDQMQVVRNQVQGLLSSISGVGEVRLKGYVEPNLRVWLQPEKLKYYALTASDVMAAITAEQLEQPAGRVESLKEEINLRVLGESKSPEEFGKIRIHLRGGAPNFNPIELKEVARIEEGLSDVRARSRFNGKPTVGLAVVKQHGANAVEVSKRVQERLPKIQEKLVPGYHLEVRLDSTQYIRESVHELNFTLLLSAVLTSLVCFLFLGSWSSTIHVLLAIPTSVMGSFLFLYFLGFTLNSFTLLGLILAMGIVVDDAIMMLENIVRHAGMGKSRKQAALDGANEIYFSAMAATLAVAAIFVPVIFMKGVMGRFFYQYGVTVSVSVFLSLLEAVTLTPMRCSQFLITPKHAGQGGLTSVVAKVMDQWTEQYQILLGKLLRHRIPILVGALIFFLGSLVLLKGLPEEFIPKQDQSLFILQIKNPVGSSLDASDELFKQVEAFLSRQPEVSGTYSTVGNYQNQDGVNAGAIYVMLKDPKQRKETQSQLMDRFRSEVQRLLPSSRVLAQDLSITGFSASQGYPIEFSLEGPDWSRLHELSLQVMDQMKDSDFFQDVDSDEQAGMPEIQIIADRLLASNHGVSLSSMAQEVSLLIGGETLGAGTQYPREGHRYGIRLRAEPESRSSISDLKRLRVRNNRGSRGELVPLSSIAQIQLAHSPQLIHRLNRQRTVPIHANLREGQSQKAALVWIQQLGQRVLPPGYSVHISGNARAFEEAFDSLGFALVLGVMVSYMILASQFNSWVQPLVVLVALPFSLSGAFMALFFTHQSLNVFSLMGLILLMGITKKNSILLVDFTQQKRREGLSLHAALLEACPIRLRPIVMTSVATLAGALPGALALGPGSETRIPMAIATLGGVFVSTVLTLLVVPCVYSVLGQFEKVELDS